MAKRAVDPGPRLRQGEVSGRNEGKKIGISPGKATQLVSAVRLHSDIRGYTPPCADQQPLFYGNKVDEDGFPSTDLRNESNDERFDREESCKSLCAGCQITTWSDCLSFSLRHNEKFGVWGGLTRHERKRFVRYLRAKNQAPSDNPHELEKQVEIFLKAQALADPRVGSVPRTNGSRRLGPKTRPAPQIDRNQKVKRARKKVGRRAAAAS